MAYVPLHAHDTYGSIGDATLRITDYVKKAKEFGCPAAAITNHGSLSTFMEFYEKCIEYDIKPIVGCEFYIASDRLSKDKVREHIILLAKDYEGLKNLVRLHNRAQDEGFYYKPRIDLELIKEYSEGLICMTACVSGVLGRAFREKNSNQAADYIERLTRIFGDDLYLEIQPGRFKEQIAYNDFLVGVAKAYSLKIVATSDIHYLSKEDADTHNYHVLDCRKADISGETFVYPDSCYYLMSEKEMRDSFVKTRLVNSKLICKAIRNTLEVAAKCSLIIPKTRIMPVFDEKIDEDREFESLCAAKLSSLKSFLGDHYAEYKNRLDHELDTIFRLGFSGYFLIVKDICDFCDRRKIARGPGRGSCAGSLVSFLLGISVADPIKYGLLFERFLSVHRTANPDIDIDIEPRRKNEVYEYIISKYGRDKCCYVSTFNMRKARNAVKTACRLMKIPPDEANRISSTIPYVFFDELGEKKTDISVKEAYDTFSSFSQFCDEYPGLLELAEKLEGYPASMGVHPAGIIISPVSITDTYPLIKVKDAETKEYKSIMATSLDLKDVEKLSGVKFDLLSLSSLEVINSTKKMAGIEFDFLDEAIYKEEKVWRLIASEYTAGLFQISSDVYKSRLNRLKPKSIKELAACLALVRGPCISSGMDRVYMQILEGEREAEKLHDFYWEATKDTLGVLIYQEQILKICVNIGFDAETAYDILKAVSKKKMEKIAAFKEKFIELGRARGVHDDVLLKIWKRIQDSGLYAFNVAHAVSYALMSYESAWLKYHYTLEYMCNLLTKEAGQGIKKEALEKIIYECGKLGIELLAPDINKSKWEFTIEDGRIRIGYCAIKGIGEAVYRSIKEAGPFKDFDDFLEKAAGRTVNRRAVLILILIGMFDGCGTFSSAELAEYYMKEIRKEKDWDGRVNIGQKGSISFLDGSDSIYEKLLGSRKYRF